MAPSAGTEKAFPRFMELPSKIRKQIRSEAIKEAMGDIRSINNPKPSCSRLSVVSKEWREDVEEALFSEITIDPLDEQLVSNFMKLFSTNRRRRFLTRLAIAVDGDVGAFRPWHYNYGIMRIAEIMRKIGQLFQYINAWKFRREDGSQQPLIIEIIIVLFEHKSPRYHKANDEQLNSLPSPLWDDDHRSVLADDGGLPIGAPLEAILSEFPPSLNMVKRFRLVADFLPLTAAQKLIQTMPNLETCLLEPMFDFHCEEAYEGFNGLIHQLRTSAPSLRTLVLATSVADPTLGCDSRAMTNFAAALRDYSQSLESLAAAPFDLDREFFLPFSLRIGDIEFTTREWSYDWTWPKLKHLELQFLDDMMNEDYSADSEWIPSWKRDPKPTRDEILLSPVDTLIAAGRATAFMPVLTSVHISVGFGSEERAIFVKRILPFPWSRPTTRYCLTGCSAVEEGRILSQWGHFLQVDRTLDPNLKDEFFDPGPRLYPEVPWGREYD